MPNPGPPGMLVAAMKNRIGLVLLVLIGLGLFVGLIMVKDQSKRQHQADTEMVYDYSNRWVKTSNSLDEQKQVAAVLQKDLEAQKQTVAELSNNLSDISTELTNTSQQLKQTQADLQREVSTRDTKIAQLENQNQALDQKAMDLSTDITNLTTQITETQRKLAASEGDKVFLEGQLKRLMAEKADLERQFNDLAVLRAQVSKLKQELNIARRIEWIRKGLFASFDEKGAQRLMQGASAQPMQARAPKPNYDLNVEVSADGSVKVIPPTNPGATNSPPAK